MSVTNFDKLRHKMLQSTSLAVFFCIVILQIFTEIIVMHDVISGCACFVYVVIETKGSESVHSTNSTITFKRLPSFRSLLPIV